jgi:hypothetical protein
VGSASDGLLQPGDKIGITKLTSIFPRIEKKGIFFLKLIVSQNIHTFSRSIQLIVHLWLTAMLFLFIFLNCVYKLHKLPLNTDKY